MPFRSFSEDAPFTVQKSQGSKKNTRGKNIGIWETKKFDQFLVDIAMGIGKKPSFPGGHQNAAINESESPTKTWKITSIVQNHIPSTHAAFCRSCLLSASFGILAITIHEPWPRSSWEQRTGSENGVDSVYLHVQSLWNMAYS